MRFQSCCNPANRVTRQMTPYSKVEDGHTCWPQEVKDFKKWIRRLCLLIVLTYLIAFLHLVWMVLLTVVVYSPQPAGDDGKHIVPPDFQSGFAENGGFFGLLCLPALFLCWCFFVWDDEDVVEIADETLLHRLIADWQTEQGARQLAGLGSEFLQAVPDHLLSALLTHRRVQPSDCVRGFRIKSFNRLSENSARVTMYVYLPLLATIMVPLMLRMPKLLASNFYGPGFCVNSFAVCLVPLLLSCYVDRRSCELNDAGCCRFAREVRPTFTASQLLLIVLDITNLLETSLPAAEVLRDQNLLNAVVAFVFLSLVERAVSLFLLGKEVKKKDHYAIASLAFHSIPFLAIRVYTFYEQPDLGSVAFMAKNAVDLLSSAVLLFDDSVVVELKEVLSTWTAPVARRDGWAANTADAAWWAWCLTRGIVPSGAHAGEEDVHWPEFCRAVRDQKCIVATLRKRGTWIET